MIKSAPASKCRLTGQGKPIRNGPRGLKLCRGQWVYWAVIRVADDKFDPHARLTHTHTHQHAQKGKKPVGYLATGSSRNTWKFGSAARKSDMDLILPAVVVDGHWALVGSDRSGP